MITYLEAVRIIDGCAKPLKARRIQVDEAGGRFIAEDLVARFDSPPFANSAVDGFGRRAEDLNAKRLRLVGKIKAGDKGSIEVHPGETVRIFTGGPIPIGITAVSMQEDCVADGSGVTFQVSSAEGEHLRPAGDDFRKGNVVLRKGDYLGPAQIGIVISAGHREVLAYPIPMVSMLTTGRELINVRHELMPWKIYDSNFYSLSNAVGELFDDWTIATSSDKPAVLRKRMAEALQGDVVVTSGGVSVGEFDLMKEEFAHWNVMERFWQVAIKPGKPIYFGTLGERLIFGLPGNPVSALIPTIFSPVPRF